MQTNQAAALSVGQSSYQSARIPFGLKVGRAFGRLGLHLPDKINTKAFGSNFAVVYS